MHRLPSDLSDPSCTRELLEALPVAAALFSNEGELLCATPAFCRAALAGNPSDKPVLRARFSQGVDRATLLGNGALAQDARARRLSNGQILVWLEEVSDEAQRRRRAFLAIASHDLRGAIANSRSYASLLMSPRMELGERARHCAEVIQRNADRALRQLSECFDLFLHQLGALDLDCAREDLGAVFDDVVAQARTLAGARGVRLEAEVSSRLPSATVDRARLTQAALAFVAHSVARVRRGDPVRFSVKEQRRGILVQVGDQEGVPRSGAAGQVYDAEARAVAEGKLGNGFRLGLARAVIEAHGGEVGIRTGEGSGSAFLFTLPIDRGTGATALSASARGS